MKNKNESQSPGIPDKIPDWFNIHEETNLPLVTVGIVNCNRLFYLKSCLESFIECTSDYPNKEIIIVDNASIEEGTEDYLKEKEAQGIKVVRMPARDPSNEFARGLNTIVEASRGDYVLLLQGDMQFVVKGKWLHRYVELYQQNEDAIGCICLDAQRSVTHAAHKFSEPVDVNGFSFVADFDRPPSSGAADVLYSRKTLNYMGRWSEHNSEHEGSDDSETKMLKRVYEVCQQKEMRWASVLPIFPVSVAIYTDSRGTNARVRGNSRYGDYWPPKKDFRYYEIYEYDDLLRDKKFLQKTPIEIEKVAKPIGWEAPIDSTGVWKKNPIRPDTADPSEFVILQGEISQKNNHTTKETEHNMPDYMNEWLEEEQG